VKETPAKNSRGARKITKTKVIHRDPKCGKRDKKIWRRRGFPRAGFQWSTWVKTVYSGAGDGRFFNCPRLQPERKSSIYSSKIDFWLRKKTHHPKEGGARWVARAPCWGIAQLIKGGNFQPSKAISLWKKGRTTNRGGGGGRKECPRANA